MDEHYILSYIERILVILSMLKTLKYLNKMLPIHKLDLMNIMPMLQLYNV